ncbi:ParB N-terminal domain-containing protein [Bradyrhizobium sp. CCGB20]|uniref:ParB/RepB/Spo0J family partition protein n=1 Tax=Bradyrhizobium sp. CCGB20 TaxID=2949633 RepID=UPI0020B33CB8|nr:ParB N-terminal domain-containing protein [Bradyrhizobium sp. CCGB20]MCP3395751.1 ParB N-terminal domain-containing protein [Bradyrhizobium sp. CCGB20]
MSRKKTKRARRTLTRGNVARPSDTRETVEDLEARLSTAGAPTLPVEAGAIVQVDRKHLKVAEKVFQWRVQGRNQIPSDDHILQLAQVIQRGEQMPPILVFPVGQDYYVMDGHHRLAAYDMASWGKPIPARVFTGNLREAERAALRANNKNKLPFNRDDRTAAAWRLVRQKDPHDSIRSIMEDTGVGKGTVNNMRDVLKKLETAGYSPEEIRASSWNRARQVASRSPEGQEHEDWIEAEAQKLVDAIRNAKLGARLLKYTDITALALAKLSPDLPDALIAEWAPEPEIDLNAPLTPEEEDF